MAETVLSMARSLVGSAVSKAASAAANEMSLLIGVQNEIWFIKDEMKTMQAFLRAAEVTKQKDELVKVWAEQVRDLAYDIEDCLEEFAVHVGRQSLSRQLMKLRHRHRIAVQIRSLKLRVEEVSNRNMRYNLIKPAPSSSMDDSASSVDVIRYQPAHYVDEAELVGFASPKKELLEMISSNNGLEVQVIWVVGAGGLGKTTLAKRVYESSEISTNFACRAWITVSQSFHVKELLKDMIKQLLGKNSLEQCKGVVHERDLTDHLKEGLKDTRYFLVLDDLWDLQAWDCIKPNFWGNNNKGSRVVVTTRNGDLVERPNSSARTYHLKTLEDDHAAQLLLRKVNRSLADIENNQMKEIFGKTLKKCGGLPLAIVTIGGLLAGKDVKEWKILYNQLPSELESNPSLEAMRNVVALSYNHLPSHLKPCFLYLSIFPEDFEIKKGRLVDRWIAEGFVKARDGMTIKDVGGSYFDELINRSMIQPSRINIQGIVKSCRVHDIMRDITISISRCEKFVYSIGDNETTVAEENFRHVTYHSSKCPNIGIDWSHVRSLTVFDERPNALLPSLCSPQLRMLRVLDLEDAQFSITQKDINNISLLRHLKHLRFQGLKQDSYIYSLPRSIGKLQSLQTLDMRGTYIATLPTEISKLQNIRSLRCSIGSFRYFDLDDPIACLRIMMCLPAIFTPLVDPDTRAKVIAELHMAASSYWSETYGVKVPKGIGSLRELQILEVVDIKRTGRKAIEELGRLSQLRKLRVETRGAAKKKHKIFCEAIQRLSSLQSLSVDAVGSSLIGTLEWMNSISSLPPLLRTLRLVGYLGVMPSWFGNLTQLVKLELVFSRLCSLGILGALPNLMLLLLCENAYVEEKLVFGAGAFLNLRKLGIWGLEQLREIGFKGDASPQMERIEICRCRLELGIIGIKHLPRLKEISLRYDVEVAKLGMLEEEVDAHPNHPVLQMAYDRSRLDLGERAQPDEGSAPKVEATESLPEGAGESSQVVTLTTNDS